MYFDDRESVSSAGSKRGREDEDEELSWTEEDVDTMQAVSSTSQMDFVCRAWHGQSLTM